MSWETYVRRVEPYVPGEQPKDQKVIKLNTNECPYPPSPHVQRELQMIQNEQLKLYPDPDAAMLTEALARYYGVKEAQVFAGVGSDDVLAMAFMTFFHSEKPILFPDITYSFYDVWAQLFGISYEQIALTEEFRIDPADYIRPNGGIIFPNPNAPTGVLESLDTIEQILQANPDVVVIVDEAYIDFGGVSCLPLLARYDNLLVVQTFSKSRALAGMRIGFAIGSERMIGYLKDVKFSFNSYTLNLPAIRCGAKSIQDREYFQETVEKIITTREWTKKALLELGFIFPDSYANFIFAKHPRMQAREIFEALKQEHVYVRYFPKPRIDNYLRITIGTMDQMQELIRLLKGTVSAVHRG